MPGRYLLVCALDPAHMDRKRWPHAAELTVNIYSFCYFTFQTPRAALNTAFVMIISTVATRGPLTLAQCFHSVYLGFVMERLLAFQTWSACSLRLCPQGELGYSPFPSERPFYFDTLISHRGTFSHCASGFAWFPVWDGAYRSVARRKGVRLENSSW